MARRRRGGRLVRNAALQTQVRFGPQERALALLLADAKAELKGEIKTARGAARGTRKAAKAARVPITKAYDSSDAARTEATVDVDRVLGGLSGSVDPFRAAVARERGGAETRSAESRAAALKELELRRVGAKAGAQFAISNARQEYRGEKAKIKGELLGIAGDRGTFAAATLGTLTENKAGRRVTVRGQNETSRHNRAQERLDREREGRIARGEGKKDGKKKLTREEYKARSAVLSARQQYRKFNGNYRRYREDGEKNGVPLPIIHGGYELEKQGYIGPNTRRELREIGISIPKRWARKPKRGSRRQVQVFPGIRVNA